MASQDLTPVVPGASLRVTRPRLAVLAAVQDHPPADTETLIRLVRGPSHRYVPAGRTP